jgi:hypothetical protein
MGEANDSAEVREDLAGHSRARQELIPILQGVALGAVSLDAHDGILTS